MFLLFWFYVRGIKVGWVGVDLGEVGYIFFELNLCFEWWIWDIVFGC